MKYRGASWLQLVETKRSMLETLYNSGNIEITGNPHFENLLEEIDRELDKRVHGLKGK